MYSYHIGEKDLFVINFVGDTNLDDIINYLNEFKEINYLTNDIKLLYDFSDANLDLKAADVKIIADLADKVTHKYTSVKTAFVVEKPLITAYSYMFSSMNETSQKERKVFSTIIAAEDWLMSSF